MNEQGIIRTYFFHPLTNGGANTPGQIKDNLISLECIVRLAVARCPQIRPVVPQAQWACLIGIQSYEQALQWCEDELATCSLGFQPQVGEGARAGQALHPTPGVLREIRLAEEMETKGELGLFKDLELMAQFIHDLRNGH